jgi:hypothetical protein
MVLVVWFFFSICTVKMSPSCKHFDLLCLSPSGSVQILNIKLREVQTAYDTAQFNDSSFFSLSILLHENSIGAILLLFSKSLPTFWIDKKWKFVQIFKKLNQYFHKLKVKMCRVSARRLSIYNFAWCLLKATKIY